jgi:hypothetical protein
MKAALCDGSVTSVVDDVDLSVWRAASTTKGAEVYQGLTPKLLIVTIEAHRSARPRFGWVRLSGNSTLHACRIFRPFSRSF